MVKKKKHDRFVVSVRELAKQNEANRRVLEIMAEEFQVPVNQIRIISGHHHSSKLLRVEAKEL